MIVEPAFGTSEWILEHCSMTHEPTDAMLALAILGILAVVCFYAWMFSYSEEQKMKKFLINKKLMQEYSENKNGKA
jgi:hypothetical protein